MIREFLSIYPNSTYWGWVHLGLLDSEHLPRWRVGESSPNIGATEEMKYPKQTKTETGQRQLIVRNWTQSEYKWLCTRLAQVEIRL